MAISDNKITNAEIAEVHVQAAPDTLTGSAQQNKAVFDAYSDLIKEKHNSLIDDIDGEYASNWRNGSQTGSVRTTGSEEEAEGYYTIGQYATAEGRQTRASGDNSHAEGVRTIASKNYSHAEGYLTFADGNGAHAEGRETLASGNNSHAEGLYANARGDNSHAEGNSTEANGDNSHAEGHGTIASSSDQHVSGRYNIEDANNIYAEIIGIGTSLNSENGRTLDWNGNEVLAGKLTVGTEPVNNKDVTTKGYVDTGLAAKVDKVTGKGLSTEDYTTAEKAKLSNIESGAEVNVQADWETNDTNSDAYINNKPYIPTKTSDLTNDSNYATEAYVENGLDGKVDKETGKGLSANDYTSEEKALVETIPEKVDKQTGKGLSSNDYTTAEKTKLSGIEAGAEVNVQSDWSQNNSSADDYIKNKPTLPTKTSDLTNDSDYTTKQYVDGKLPIGEASGTIASVKDGADEMPMKSLTATIVPKQSGSGTPSPDNVRPISGWTEVETVVCGENLFDISGWINSFAEGQQVTFENDTMTAGMSAGNLYTKPFRFSKTNTTITLSFASADAGTSIAPRFELLNENGSAVGSLTLSAGGGTITRDAVAVRMNWSSIYGFSVTKPQIELGTTATAYEPYTATTHTTSLGRTVYGGTVDLVSGVLTVDKIMTIFDGSEDWQRYPTGSASAYAMSTAITTGRPKANARPLCNYADGLITSDTYGEHDCFVSTSDLIRWVAGKSDITTVADWKAYLAQNPLQVCYELSTPTTYQLTPQTINTLQGVNNVWADCGDVAIEYVRDIGLALDNLLPDSPTTDGTYTLVCTVSDGKATIAWQSSGASLSSPLSMSSPASLNSQINTTEEEGDSNEIR